MRPDLGGELTDRDGPEDPTVRDDGLLLEAAGPRRSPPMSRGSLPLPCEDRDNVIGGCGPGRGRHAVAAQAAASCRHPASPDERKEQLVDGIAGKRQGAGEISRLHVVGSPVLQLDQGFEGLSLTLIQNC